MLEHLTGYKMMCDPAIMLQLLLDTFPHLEDLVLRIPIYKVLIREGMYHLVDVLNTSQLFTSRDVVSCISGLCSNLYADSPTSPLTADFLKRTLCGGIRGIFIKTSQPQDMKTLLQIATDAGIKWVDFTRFTSVDVSALVGTLRELFIFSIVREAEDCEEVSKEEVDGAGQVLDLLADINRRGMLFRVILSKVFFLHLEHHTHQLIPQKLLLLCNSWLKKLGGERRVTQLATDITSSGSIGLAPYVAIEMSSDTHTLNIVKSLHF